MRLHKKVATAVIAFVMAGAGLVIAPQSATAGDLSPVAFKSPGQLGATPLHWEFESTWGQWTSCRVVRSSCHIGIWSDRGLDDRRDSLLYSQVDRVFTQSQMREIVTYVQQTQREWGLKSVRRKAGSTTYWIWRGVTKNIPTRTYLVLAVNGKRYGMLHQQAAGRAPFSKSLYVSLPTMVNEALRLANPASGIIPAHGQQNFILIEPEG